MDDTVTRPDDMSTTGDLTLMRCDDGDIIITVRGPREDGLKSIGESVEFCAPGTGGGHSPRTWWALIALWKAMREDAGDVAHTSCDSERDVIQERERIITLLYQLAERDCDWTVEQVIDTWVAEIRGDEIEL